MYQKISASFSDATNTSNKKYLLLIFVGAICHSVAMERNQQFNYETETNFCSLLQLIMVKTTPLQVMDSQNPSNPRPHPLSTRQLLKTILMTTPVIHPVQMRSLPWPSGYTLEIQCVIDVNIKSKSLTRVELLLCIQKLKETRKSVKILTLISLIMVKTWNQLITRMYQCQFCTECRIVWETTKLTQSWIWSWFGSSHATSQYQGCQGCKSWHESI